MYLPKEDIYKLLKDNTAYYVAQTQPPTFTELPALIFKVGNNSVDVDLDNTIAMQEIEIVIDIWAETSKEASKALSETESLMRSDNYIMTFSEDIPNPGNIYHINSRFTKKL